MANNPRHNGGSTDAAAGSKVMRLLQLCDVFHLPIVSLADEPGFMVGLESEKQGIERAGAQLVSVTCQSRMPWITIVIGRLFGVAGQCHHRPTGMFRRYAWPSATWGSMHIAGGTSAAYRREIDTAPDPEAKRLEIEERLNAIASPFRTAEATGQDIIDPRETRSALCEFAEDAQRVLRTQLGRTANPVPALNAFRGRSATKRSAGDIEKGLLGPPWTQASASRFGPEEHRDQQPCKSKFSCKICMDD